MRLTIGHEVRPGRLRDICRDAALVEVHRACALGEEVSLSSSCRGGRAHPGVGHRHPHCRGDGDARAVAVLFRDVQPAAEGRIEMFLPGSAEAAPSGRGVARPA